MLLFVRKTYLFWFFILSSCSQNGPAGLFKKVSPHEQYASNLRDAGLLTTALGREWLAAAEKSLQNPLTVSIPYMETGYFPASQAMASALRFQARRGTKISIDFSKKPLQGFTVYIDLWEDRKGENKRLLAYADTNGAAFHYEVDDRDAFYILRLQPELLSAGEYTLSITSGPSLAFPVKGGKMQSFWGAARDAGARQHEGIDIFAPKRTPALAVADGVINRVGINNLGGKVVFLRPHKKNFSIYYAHLDTQLVSGGQSVKVGDTLGLVGNTGNARGGSPHLHLGIYGSGGAIDPFHFIDPVLKKPQPITSKLTALGRAYRTSTAGKLFIGPSRSAASVASLEANTFVRILSASSSWYKVALPDGLEGYLPSGQVRTLENSLDRYRVTAESPLLDKPNDATGSKRKLTTGDDLLVYARFQDYMYVKLGELDGWVKTPKAAGL
ncbi:peptidoglycan DD-metalloendopeptidase family protein [Arcticibacter sp.]|jgi:murein DD-endopeptidase MepM/ murein hydrolase activator NlpD|uniref:peptidoglycan DD-metalloendopeptidase family protein n=1 Tax=Arcticibacter sp. TaxID=1872630 RepID=UPI003890E9EA